MAYHAVIFDLFGTLVDDFISLPFHQCLREMADALGADADAFRAIWTDEAMMVDRMTSKSSTFEAHMALICSKLALQPSPQQVALTREIRREFTRLTLTPREDAVATLACLKDAGYRTGLISDCTWEVPEFWGTTPFAPLIDVPVFSCVACMKKPDHRIYQHACTQLGVEPGQCLYVADGSSMELTGAVNAGMDAMLICVPYERESVLKRDDPKSWQGPVIESLDELLAYLEINRETVPNAI